MPEEKVKAEALRASIKSVEQSDNDIELVVRFSNTATRALHYIADVRTTKYDPATRTLTLSLSDEGRELIPLTITKLPVFRHIDPGSDAEIQLKVPNKLIKLSRTAPPGKLAFETHLLSDMQELVVDVAWADVPYYKDTRVTDDKRFPAVRWQQHKARATKRMKVVRKPKS